MESHGAAIASLQASVTTLSAAVGELKSHAARMEHVPQAIVDIQATLKQVNAAVEALQPSHKHKPRADYAFQGNVVQAPTNTEPELPLNLHHSPPLLGQSSARIVTIQLHGTGYFLSFCNGSPFTFPIEHFGFQLFHNTQDVQTNPRCLFLMEPVEGGKYMLRSVSHGDLVSLKRDYALYPDGYVATTQENEDDSAHFSLTILNAKASAHDGFQMVIVVGTKRHHLYCATIKDYQGRPYKMLATRSILPEPFGVFIVRQVHMAA